MTDRTAMQCQVPGCDNFAVIYDPQPDWNLCAKHTKDRRVWLHSAPHQPPKVKP